MLAYRSSGRAGVGWLHARARAQGGSGALCALCVLASAWWVGPLDRAGAQETSTPAVVDSAALEERVRELSSSLRCPVCLNLSIEDSPDPLARAMKARVREMLAAGATPEEVREHFVERYGEWILLTPEPTGFNLALWILPAVGLLGGVILIWLVVRRWVDAPASEAAGSSGAEP